MHRKNQKVASKEWLTAVASLHTGGIIKISATSFNRLIV